MQENQLNHHLSEMGKDFYQGPNRVHQSLLGSNLKKC